METNGKSKMQEKKKVEKEKEEPTMNVNKGRMHKENLQKKINEEVRMIIPCFFQYF